MVRKSEMEINIKEVIFGDCENGCFVFGVRTVL